MDPPPPPARVALASGLGLVTPGSDCCSDSIVAASEVGDMLSCWFTVMGFTSVVCISGEPRLNAGEAVGVDDAASGFSMVAGKTSADGSDTPVFGTPVVTSMPNVAAGA